MKATTCILALAALLASAPNVADAQVPDGQTNCTDDCIWYPGLGWKCGAGSAGCKCHGEDYTCYYYTCGGPICGPLEEDEDDATPQPPQAAPCSGSKWSCPGGFNWSSQQSG